MSREGRGIARERIFAEITAPEGAISRLEQDGEKEKEAGARTPSSRITMPRCAPRYHKQTRYYTDPPAPPDGPVPHGLLQKN